MKQVEMNEKKVNKSKFLAYVAAKNGMSITDVTKVFDSIVDGIMELTGDGHELSLTGFGVFTVKTHKGHPVQFGAINGKRPNVKDYAVLKYSASDVLNRQIRERRGDLTENEDTLRLAQS